MGKKEGREWKEEERPGPLIVHMLLQQSELGQAKQEPGVHPDTSHGGKYSCHYGPDPAMC